MIYTELLDRFPIISDQIDRPALGVVLNALEQTLGRGIAGDIAEFGCYRGTTSLFIRRLLDRTKQSTERRFYAYDSFEGLPAKSPADISAAGVMFQAGELQVSKKQFLQEFQKAGLMPPRTIKAWFSDLQTEQLPIMLAYVFLDGDFYSSILESLQLAWPRLQPGGIAAIDDYQRATLPGVERAVDDFFQGNPPPLRLEHNIAIIRKA